MRDYAKISPTFWTQGTGKMLRGHVEAQLVALYLMSAPSSTMLGLYYLPIPTLCHETGLPLEGARKGLRRCREVGFAFYDDDTETVWVPEMAKFQIADALPAKDNRIKGVERELEAFRKTPFFGWFLARYREAFRLSTPSPSEAPSKPLRSQEQDQDQDQDQHTPSAGAREYTHEGPPPAHPSAAPVAPPSAPRQEPTPPADPEPGHVEAFEAELRRHRVIVDAARGDSRAIPALAEVLAGRAIPAGKKIPWVVVAIADAAADLAASPGIAWDKAAEKIRKYADRASAPRAEGALAAGSRRDRGPPRPALSMQEPAGEGQHRWKHGPEL